MVKGLVLILTNGPFLGPKVQKYKNFTKSFRKIFLKVFVMSSIQKYVIATTFTTGPNTSRISRQSPLMHMRKAAPKNYRQKNLCSELQKFQDLQSQVNIVEQQGTTLIHTTR